VVSLGSPGLRIGLSTFPVSTVLGELQVGSSTISPPTASEQGLGTLIISAFGAGISPIMDLASQTSVAGSRGMGNNASADNSAFSYSSGEVDSRLGDDLWRLSSFLTIAIIIAIEVVWL